jgi:hypothetical protein
MLRRPTFRAWALAGSTRPYPMVCGRAWHTFQFAGFVPAFSEYSVVEGAWALPAVLGHQQAAPGNVDAEKAWQTSQVRRAFTQHSCALLLP